MTEKKDMKSMTDLPPLPHVPKGASFEQKEYILNQYLRDIRAQNQAERPAGKPGNLWQRIRSIFQNTYW